MGTPPTSQTPRGGRGSCSRGSVSGPPLGPAGHPMRPGQGTQGGRRTVSPVARSTQMKGDPHTLHQTQVPGPKGSRVTSKVTPHPRNRPSRGALKATGGAAGDAPRAAPASESPARRFRRTQSPLCTRRPDQSCPSAIVSVAPSTLVTYLMSGFRQFDPSVATPRLFLTQCWTADSSHLQI